MPDPVADNKQLVTQSAQSERTPLLFDQGGSLQFPNIEALHRFAVWISNSGLAPTAFQKPEAIAVAICFGKELGLSPMAALQNLAVINGRPSLFGDAQLAIVRGSGKLELFDEQETNGEIEPLFRELAFTEEPAQRKELLKRIAILQAKADSKADDFGVSVAIRRKGFETQFSRFSIADAKQAGLWGKQGPWSQYPKRMLKFRARGFILRDQFGDFLKGISNAEEEFDRTVDVRATATPVYEEPPTPIIPLPVVPKGVEHLTNGKPAVAAPQPPVEGIRPPRRKREPVVDVQAIAQPPPPAPEPEPEPEPTKPEPQPEPEPEPAGTSHEDYPPPQTAREQELIPAMPATPATKTDDLPDWDDPVSMCNAIAKKAMTAAVDLDEIFAACKKVKLISEVTDDWESIPIRKLQTIYKQFETVVGIAMKSR